MYEYAVLSVGSVMASESSQLQRQKNFRVAALCETAKQLQSRLQNETRRFHSDFSNQGFNSLLIITVVFTRDSIYAIARICYGNSVCPSVRLLHGWISQKRLKLGSRNFHHTVAPSL